MRLVRYAIRWGPLIGWMGVLFYLSSRSTLPGPPQALGPIARVSFFDKIEHLVAYLVLALLTLWALYSMRPILLRSAIVVGITFTYGLSDEMHQAFVPRREFAWGDLAADTMAGVIVASATVLAWLAFRARPWRRPSAARPAPDAGDVPPGP